MSTRRVLTALIVVMSIVLSTLHVSADSTFYSDPAGRFSFTVPEDFEQVTGETRLLTALPSDNAVAFFSPVLQSAGFSVTSTTNDMGRNPLSRLAQDSLDSIPRGPLGGTVSVVTNTGQGTMVAQRPAVAIEYIATTPEGRIHVQQVVVQYDDTLFTFTFSAREQDFGALVERFGVVLDSFMFS